MTAPSDVFGILTRARLEGTSRTVQADGLRPKGRPRTAESDRRRREFVRLITTGADFDVAARDAKIKPERALKILSQPEVRQLVAGVQRAAA